LGLRTGDARFWKKEQANAKVEAFIVDEVYATLSTPPFMPEEQRGSCGGGLFPCLAAGCQRRVCEGGVMVGRQNYNAA